MKKAPSVPSSSMTAPSLPRHRDRSKTTLHNRGVSDDSIVSKRISTRTRRTHSELKFPTQSSHQEEGEFSMPLLVRKLSVFRKGLVRERNLRTQAEATADRLKETVEKLKERLN